MKNIIIFWSCIFVVLCLLRCQKKDIIGVGGKNQVKVSISLKGVQNVELSKNAFVNTIDGLQMLRTHEMHDGFESISTFQATSMHKTDKYAATEPPTGTTRLGEGIKYRLIIYKLNEELEEEFYTFVDFVSQGEGGQVIAYEGDILVWYAYSYNTDEDIVDIDDFDHPVVDMGVNKDFLYAKGQLEIVEGYNALVIILQRKTAQIGIEIDARGLFTDEIRNMTLVLPANIIKSAHYDIREDERTTAVISLPQQTIPLASFENVDEGYNDRKVVYLYTAVPEVWNNLSFTLQNLAILLDDNSSTRSYPTSSFTIAKEFDIEVGKRYRGKLDLIESALTFGGVSWARENLYRMTSGRNPYRFYHENKQTDDYRSYFSFKGHIPGKWGSTVIGGQKDPCALVYPANRWMQPTKSSFANLTRISNGVSIDGILPTVVGNLLGLFSTDATTNATFGANYIQYNTATGVSAVYPQSSNVLRFYYNGYDAIDLNVLGDGWVSLDLMNSYGLATALWTSDQGLNVLGLVGVGAWGYFGSTRNVLFSNQKIAKGFNSVQLLNVDALNLNVLSSARKNVRCIRNPNWETLSQDSGYNPEPDLN